MNQGSLLYRLSHSKLCRLAGSLLFVMLVLPLTNAQSAAQTFQQQIDRQHEVLSPYQTQISARFDLYQPLLGHIFSQLKKRSLPPQLALLPMLESSLNPDAISHAGARGLWQLMPATAQRFGLTITPQDQRLDVFHSTDAALQYLTFLYNKFSGDLALTIAAYNAGEGRVARAMARANSREFEHLILPAETRQYVARFYALNGLVDVDKLDSGSFSPLMLFSSQPRLTRQPLIDLQPLPPLVKL